MTFEELSDQFYEDLNGFITAVTSDDEGYRMLLLCDDWENRDRRRRFELQFEDVVESMARPSATGCIYRRTNHPLLWQHNDEHKMMFFSSAPLDPERLIGRLYVAHNSLLHGWRQLDDYLYAGVELLRQGNGLFARGPCQVIHEYARVVGDDLKTSILASHTPKGGYQAVLFDECFVICRSVVVCEAD